MWADGFAYQALELWLKDSMDTEKGMMGRGIGNVEASVCTWLNTRHIRRVSNAYLITHHIY